MTTKVFQVDEMDAAMRVARGRYVEDFVPAHQSKRRELTPEEREVLQRAMLDSCEIVGKGRLITGEGDGLGQKAEGEKT